MIQEIGTVVQGQWRLDSEPTRCAAATVIGSGRNVLQDAPTPADEEHILLAAGHVLTATATAVPVT